MARYSRRLALRQNLHPSTGDLHGLEEHPFSCRRHLDRDHLATRDRPDVPARGHWCPNPAPVTREQRKADTAAANKAGELVPAGQAGPKMAVPSGSTMTKDERKAQAQADAKAGQMAGAGDAAAHQPAPKTKSTKTRADRKAETKAANKSGQIKSGEASSR
jgi:hypothetical protein